MNATRYAGTAIAASRRASDGVPMRSWRRSISSVTRSTRPESHGPCRRPGPRVARFALRSPDLVRRGSRPAPAVRRCRPSAPRDRLPAPRGTTKTIASARGSERSSCFTSGVSSRAAIDRGDRPSEDDGRGDEHVAHGDDEQHDAGRVDQQWPVGADADSGADSSAFLVGRSVSRMGRGVVGHRGTVPRRARPPSCLRASRRDGDVHGRRRRAGWHSPCSGSCERRSGRSHRCCSVCCSALRSTRSWPSCVSGCGAAGRSPRS